MILPLLSLLLLFLFPGGENGTKKMESIKDKTSITYKVVHPLHEIVATSTDVYANIEADIETKKIKRVSTVVDVMTFDSGNSNRDSHAMEMVDALTYPEATFTSTGILQSKSNDSITVTGKLFFHGVTKEVTLYGFTDWATDTLKIQSNLTTTLTEFNIEKPSLLMIPVKDSLWFTISAMFRIK